MTTLAYPPAIPRLFKLKCPDDWTAWYDYIRTKSMQYGVWEYVDPDQSTEFPQQPSIALGQFSHECNNHLQPDIAAAHFELAAWQYKDAAFKSVRNLIESSISRAYLRKVLCEESVRDLINSLFQVVQSAKDFEKGGKRSTARCLSQFNSGNNPQPPKSKLETQLALLKKQRPNKAFLAGNDAHNEPMEQGISSPCDSMDSNSIHGSNSCRPGFVHHLEATEEWTRTVCHNVESGSDLSVSPPPLSSHIYHYDSDEPLIILSDCEDEITASYTRRKTQSREPHTEDMTSEPAKSVGSVCEEKEAPRPIVKIPPALHLQQGLPKKRVLSLCGLCGRQHVPPRATYPWRTCYYVLPETIPEDRTPLFRKSIDVHVRKMLDGDQVFREQVLAFRRDKAHLLRGTNSWVKQSSCILPIDEAKREKPEDW